MIKDSKTVRFLILIIIIISILLPFLAMSLNWGSLNVDVSATTGSLGGKSGNINASLDAEFDYNSIDYVVIINVSGEEKIDKNHTEYLKGMGNFQKKVGWILDSYKDKDYKIKALIWDNVSKTNVYTNITVETHVDFIPWWPVDTSQKASVTVTLNSTSALTQRVKIKKVWFELWTGWDEDKNDFTKSKKIWEQTTNQNLYKKGDSQKFDADLKVDKDYGKVGIVGHVDILVYDTNGEQVQKIILPYSSTSHPTTINIYTMTQSEYYGIILMVLAYPITLISVILSIISIPLILLRHRVGWSIILTAGIIGIFAIYFYINGLTTLVSLLNEGLKSVDVTEGFKLNYNVIVLPILSSVLLFIALPLAFLNRIPKVKKHALEQRGFKQPERKPTKDSDEPPIVFKTVGEGEGEVDIEERTEISDEMKPKKIKQTKSKRTKKKRGK